MRGKSHKAARVNRPSRCANFVIVPARISTSLVMAMQWRGLVICLAAKIKFSWVE
jgi:hypothetical protein